MASHAASVISSSVSAARAHARIRAGPCDARSMRLLSSSLCDTLACDVSIIQLYVSIAYQLHCLLALPCASGIVTGFSSASMPLHCASNEAALFCRSSSWAFCSALSAPS
jgi:hypothetical protein